MVPIRFAPWGIPSCGSHSSRVHVPVAGFFPRLFERHWHEPPCTRLPVRPRFSTSGVAPRTRAARRTTPKLAPLRPRTPAWELGPGTGGTARVCSAGARAWAGHRGCPLVLLSEPRATVLSMWLVWLHSMPAKYEGAAPGRGVLSQRAFTTSRWKS